MATTKHANHAKGKFDERACSLWARHSPHVEEVPLHELTGEHVITNQCGDGGIKDLDRPRLGQNASVGEFRNRADAEDVNHEDEREDEGKEGPTGVVVSVVGLRRLVCIKGLFAHQHSLTGLGTRGNRNFEEHRDTNEREN